MYFFWAPKAPFAACTIPVIPLNLVSRFVFFGRIAGLCSNYTLIPKGIGDTATRALKVKETVAVAGLLCKTFGINSLENQNLNPGQSRQGLRFLGEGSKQLWIAIASTKLSQAQALELRLNRSRIPAWGSHYLRHEQNIHAPSPSNHAPSCGAGLE